MRRVAGVVMAVSALVLAAATPAMARAPSPTPAAAGTGASTGTPLCKITDSKITQVSGVVATGNGYVVINDSSAELQRRRIYLLDGACKVTNSVAYPTTALDPEDLAIDKNGTLWVADIGDNSPLTGGSTGSRRSSIALWSLAPGGNQTPVIHRLAYPDGKPRDAETLLLAGDGSPVIVTKEPIGEVYVPAAPLQNNNREPVKLQKVGTFTPEKTGTQSRFGAVGWLAITGGAVSADGTKAIVRTYTDAYEFDVAGGDVAKAISSGQPRITPLPNEPQGEAIAFSPDGKSYVTVSDGDLPPSVVRYAPSTVNPAKATGAPRVPSPNAKKQSFISQLTLQDITYMVAAVGVVGLILVVAGVLGIRRSRANRRAAASAGGPGSGPGSGPGGGPARGSASVGGVDPWEDDDGDGPRGRAGRDRRRGAGRRDDRPGVDLDFDDHGNEGDGSAGPGTVYGRPAPPAMPAAPASPHGTVYGNSAYSPDDYDQRGPGGRAQYDSYDHGYEPAGYAQPGFGAGDYPPDHDGHDPRRGRGRR